MSDSEVRGPRSLAEEFSLDPDGRMRAWLRERDRMGALPSMHAALDDALACGYAQGLEEARADAIDGLRTLLLRMLELKFGDVDDDAMEQIATGSSESLGRWMLAVVSAGAVHQVFEIAAASAHREERSSAAESGEGEPDSAQ